ncbi:MAG: curved DNA-binding protein [Desulforhopalus sp.]|jgi:curved DNA-binding protein
MQTQDYYALLGTSKTASSDEVRKAYRKAARKLHPDVNKEAGAEDRFKEIGEAYGVLKDTEKRKLYDQYGRNWQDVKNGKSQQEYGGFEQGGNGEGNSFRYQGGPFDGGENLDDILKNLFGGAAHFGGGQGTSGWRQDDAGVNVVPEVKEYELQVTLEDIYFGAVKHISLQTWAPDKEGGMQQVARELKVTVPKGVTDGSVIRLGGKGVMDEKLHIRLKIAPHKRFTVAGYDLKTVVAVSPWEAILGAKVPVETADGKVNLTIPKGAQNGSQLRIKGKGLHRKKGKTGDILVTLDVRLPSGLSAEEEQLLQSIAETSRFDPRKTQRQKPVTAMSM